MYGAWVSPKDETFDVIDMCGHYNVAERITGGTNFYSPYDVLFRAGFVRIVWSMDGSVSSAEYWEKAKLAPYQRALIKEAHYKDKHEHWRIHSSKYMR